ATRRRCCRSSRRASPASGSTGRARTAARAPPRPDAAAPARCPAPPAPSPPPGRSPAPGSGVGSRPRRRRGRPRCPRWTSRRPAWSAAPRTPGTPPAPPAARPPPAASPRPAAAPGTARRRTSTSTARARSRRPRSPPPAAARRPARPRPARPGTARPLPARALPGDRAPNLHPRSRRPPAAPRRTPGSHASAGGGAGVRPARVVRRGHQGGPRSLLEGARLTQSGSQPVTDHGYRDAAREGVPRTSRPAMGESGADVTETRRDTGPGPAGPGGAAGTGRPMVMLVMATLGFALNFWAWALLSPLAPRIQESLGLTSFEQSLLVAVPVIVGSLGRIPVGALTDRFGGRVMFPALSLITIAPVL